MRTRPDVLTRIDLPDGNHLTVDEYGYLTDPDLWTPAFAEIVAEREGITLTDLHWAVIGYMRDWLEEHGVAADARFVLKFLADRLGTDKKGARDAMFELFPYGYVKQACKIAGMKQPRAWSTG